MTKSLRVARTEFLNLVRTKAFIVSLVLMPVLMGGAIVVQALLRDKVDVAARRFAVIDRGGQLLPKLRAAAAERNRAVFREGKQVLPRFLPEAAAGDPRALSDRVRDGKLFAYVVIGKHVLEGGEDQKVAYHSETPTYLDLSRWIQGVLNEEIRRRAIEQAQITPEQAKRLSRTTRVQMYGLVTVTETGQVRQAERVNQGLTFGVPAGAMFLLFMLVMITAPQQLNIILEEKMQRISEILVSSVSAFELFLGKLLGLVLVSWTLSALYLAGVAVLANRLGFASAIPASLYLYFLFFQLTALLIFGSIFSAVGAACSELRDAQSLMIPVMLVVMLPMFVWITVLKEPNSSLAMWMSLFPPATPFLMLLRVAVPPGPAAWEIAAALVLTAGFTLLCVWAAGKIFRIGILAQGQTPSIRRLIGWVLSR